MKALFLRGLSLSVMKKQCFDEKTISSYYFTD